MLFYRLHFINAFNLRVSMRSFAGLISPAYGAVDTAGTAANDGVRSLKTPTFLNIS
jgi:hypothetical protein